MAKTCQYHCRGCGGHFTSLKAFDAHKPRNRKDGDCAWPEDAPVSEIDDGECRISSDVPVIGITLYEHSEAASIREHFTRSAA
jgi:hypothetical protein